MKRTLIVIISALLLVSVPGPLFAVEKKKSKKYKQEQTDRKPPSKDSSASPGAQQQRPAKKYDNFIDENGNGIDDRRENLKKKSTPTAPDTTKSKKDKP